MRLARPRTITLVPGGARCAQRTLAVAVVDDAGRQQQVDTFANDPRGHQRLGKWLADAGVTRVGIEGSGHLGRAAAAWLVEVGFDVREVPCGFIVRERRRRAGAGKSDPNDALPGYLLFGAALVLLYRWQSALVGVLFADVPGSRAEEGPGARGLRALGHGAFAGLVGGLLFTLVMLQIGFRPIVAGIVVGFVLHFLIANTIGASYGMLFRRQSFDPGSVGWALAYGFVWWVLGALTLLPVLLGGSPTWSAPEAAEAFPSLIGHLAYGAGLGVTFQTLQARGDPWWMSAPEAVAAREAGMREQALSAAGALWTLVVLIALCVPLLLGP